MSFIVSVDSNVGVAIDWFVFGRFLASSGWIDIRSFFLDLPQQTSTLHSPQSFKDAFRQFRRIFLLQAIAFSICNVFVSWMSGVLKPIGRRKRLAVINPGFAFFRRKEGRNHPHPSLAQFLKFCRLVFASVVFIRHQMQREGFESFLSNGTALIACRQRGFTCSSGFQICCLLLGILSLFGHWEIGMPSFQRCNRKSSSLDPVIPGMDCFVSRSQYQ